MSAQSQELLFHVLDLTLTVGFLIVFLGFKWVHEYDYCNLINVNNSIHVVIIPSATTITPGN